MNYNKCKQQAIKISGGLFSEEQADDLVKRIADAMKRENADVSMNDINEQVSKVLAKEVEQVKLAALYEKRNRVLNTIKKYNAIERIENYDDIDRGIRNFLGTIDSQRLGNMERYMGQFYKAVKDEGLLPFFKGEGLGLDLARELFEATSENGKIGITGNSEAIKMAKIMTGINDDLIKHQNSYGANIRERAGYIVRQTHDSERISQAGFEEWFNDISQLLDDNLTFGALASNAEKQEFLFEAYKKLSSGLYHVAEGAANSDFRAQFKGPGNLAKKMSQHRTLHFKDAESWFKYNEKYGRGRIEEIFMDTIMRGSRNIALLQNLGTNPELMFNEILTGLQDANRYDKKKLGKIGTQFQHNMYKTLQGGLNVPENMTLYNWSNRILQLNAMGRLGSAVLSAFGDLPIAMSELRYQGVHPLEAFRNQVFSLFGEKRADLTNEEKDIFNLFATYNEGMMSDFMSRIAPISDDAKVQPGVMSNLTRLFFKFSMLTPWTDAQKTGMRFAMANNLGNISDTAFDNLTDQMKSMFTKHAINNKDWDVLRSAVTNLDGRKFLFTDLISNIDDAKIRSIFPDMSDTAIQQYKFELADKLQGLFVDRISYGVITPGLEEKTMMMGGSKRGTAWGEFKMHMWQFKSFTLTIWNKLVNPSSGREFENGINAGSMVGFASLMAQLTLSGYVITCAKDLANGKTLRDPRDPKTLLTAIAAGGGMGLLGDFIFGDYSKYGNSIADTILGPTLGGTVGNLTEIWNRAKQGDDPSVAAMRMLYSYIPGNNLFYTKWVTNYLFLYNLQEAMSPGYLHRMEQRLEDNHGQQYFIPPSEVIEPGTDDKNLFEAIGELPSRVANTMGELVR